MNFIIKPLLAGMVSALLAGAAYAAVGADEAAALKTTLTPMGAEKAGNKDGSIPAWSGGLTTPTPGFVNGGRRPDPFADEKPLYRITAQNMAQYADKLTEGTKTLLQKFPDTFWLDIYPTHRTAAAPQAVYDNTFLNATRANLVESPSGLVPEGAYAGVPFPIPKNGVEVMWNHQLRWRGESWYAEFTGYMTTPDGRRVLVLDAQNDYLMPYYDAKGAPDNFGGEYWMVRSINVGPAIRAGEAVTGRENIEADKSASWVYLTGQRRVRKLPNACCDTPTPFSAGIVSFDEVEGFVGRLGRFDWKLLGKQEMYIPYNTNRSLVPEQDEALVGSHHLNPENVRWELHRVWVVEANLKDGQRHTSPKSRYYVDEDAWIAVLGDRWDSKGQLARTTFVLPVAMPDVPAQNATTWGVYDLTSGSMFVNVVQNAKKVQNKIVPPYKDATFTPAAMTGDGVR